MGEIITEAATTDKIISGPNRKETILNRISHTKVNIMNVASAVDYFTYALKCI